MGSTRQKTDGSSVFTVGLLGLEERDRGALEGVFTLSKHRTPSFRPYAFSKDTPADLLVLDTDNPRAIKAKGIYERVHEARGNPPVIVLADQKPENGSAYYLRRPIVASRLLALLEQVATRELDYEAPAAIHPDDVAPGAYGDRMGASPASTASERLAPGAANGVKALVVDDSLPVRIQLKMALQNLANHVDFAETGEQGLELLAEHRYDIVFLDVILPGVDGYDLCKSIRQDPAKSDTPVIMLTSNSAPADRIKGRLAGCDTYLIKPVKKAVFEAVVREYLK